MKLRWNLEIAGIECPQFLRSTNGSVVEAIAGETACHTSSGSAAVEWFW